MLIEDVDYYIEGGFMVFTEAYHRNRGYCCDSGCRHCPWRESAIPTSIDHEDEQAMSDSVTENGK